jgi:phosphoribosylformimino-5-aminoimidazole carboxamide ribonucleotide (ProFAR) isomerase
MEKWLNLYGINRFILSADFVSHINKTSIKYNIAISGWQKETSTDLFEFINHYSDKINTYHVQTLEKMEHYPE